MKRAKARDLWLSFGKYIADHPEERFWQALRNWSGAQFIYFWRSDISSSSINANDTFYFEGKDK
jgi:hypothetical protein